MLNRNVLCAAMALYRDSQSDLAKALGMSRASLSYKINGRREFTASEIKQIKERYSLTPDAIDAIFFAKEVE